MLKTKEANIQTMSLPILLLSMLLSYLHLFYLCDGVLVIYCCMTNYPKFINLK